MTRGFRLQAAVFVALFAFPAASQAFIRPGDLDAGFGGVGTSTLGTLQTVVGDGFPLVAGGAAMGIEPPTPERPDLKVVVAGTALSSGRKEFAVVRYNSDGTVDSSFGTGGEVVFPVGDGDASANALLIRSDDYLVVGGTALQGSDRVFAWTMLGPTGQPVSEFNGHTGLPVLQPVGNPSTGSKNAAIQALVQGPGLSVLAVGWAADGSTTKAALARFTQVGPLDATYGPADTGIVLSDGDTQPALRGLAAEPAADGGTYVAGDTGGGPGPFALVRYDSDGGLVYRSFTPVGDGNSAHARALLEQPDGNLVLAGDAVDGGVQKFALARLSAAGTPDPAFGIGGKLLTQIGSSAKASSVTEVLGRLILASGDANVGGNTGFALAGYDMSGATDSTFGTGGTVFTPFTTSAGDPVDSTFASAAAQQADTKLVVAGGTLTSPGGKFAVARYITNVPGSSGGGVQEGFGGVLGTQASGVGAPRRAGILIGRARVPRRGRAVVRLKCVRAEGFCKGRLTVSMKARVGRKHKLRRFRVASAKFKVKTGKTGSIKLRLSHRAARKLTHRHRLRTSASAKAKDAAGHTYRDSVGLTLKTKKKRRHN